MLEMPQQTAQLKKEIKYTGSLLVLKFTDTDTNAPKQYYIKR